ncbi:MAG TPA: hypothetical protein VIL49_12535, partial [Capillimicrobium sp.]
MATIGALFMPAAASSSFPGANGRIYYVGDHTILSVDQDGGDRASLTKGLEPAASADGSRIAFSRGGDIFVIDRDGGNERQLTKGKAS